MYSLFIDTHNVDINLALYKEGKLVDSRVKSSSLHHSDNIMPLLAELLKSNNIDVHDLSEILCVNGPGSFTGVRLGVTIAKTLAFTLKLPIRTITSLEMFALSIDSESDKLVIIKDLKGCFGGLFTKDNELKGEYFYKSNQEFEDYVEKNDLRDKIVDNKVDFDKLYDFFMTKETINPHKVNPIYIKVIEALKNDKKS
ncbi:MAG: tRNA (adenosine(37)-N6)-threonylcarbamoyltransferase complex dimerization subunit type 1 TsaB [Bacilli bacterium]|nr:tRNA (adenosine(37)-N6)-threonylcarbamoyltransferase complex dimerization subunit type 1 TsaB [Bacilli bacterium]